MDSATRTLQWGRDLSAAEGPAAPSGARPLIELQWGRDRMAAEGCKNWSRADVPAALQWGRDRMAAEGCRSTADRTAVVRFNGAATGWPRKARLGRALPNRRGRFNGAATGWPRKGGAGRLPAMPSGLQWGRDRMAAEGSFVDGNLKAWLASMGPRPDGRGRRREKPPHTKRVRLQWGRDRMAAEGEECHGEVVVPVAASMGPRPDGRGRSMRMPPYCVSPVLQWGRDRMAAEGEISALFTPRNRLLQWGRDRMAAEGGLPCVLSRGALRFNGAATGWPRKVCRARMIQVHPCRFNGAATGWPRKATGRTAALLAGNVASMGPRPDGRGRLSYL